MRIRTVLSAAMGILLFATNSGMAQDTRPGVAVLTIENGGSYGQDSEDFEALEIGLQQMLTTEFAANSGLRVVDRSRIAEILGEQDLGASGRVDGETAARIGQLVGARFVVMGGFVDFFGDMRLDLRVVNTETSEIVVTSKVNDRREKLYEMVVNVASSLTSDLDLPELPREVREARAARQIPAEAIQLYTRALLYQDRGRTEQAVEYFNRAKEIFPEYTEVDEALSQIQG